MSKLVSCLCVFFVMAAKDTAMAKGCGGLLDSVLTRLDQLEQQNQQQQQQISALQANEQKKGSCDLCH
jgi:hypothetical protein